MKYQGSVAFSGSRRAEAISIPTLDRADIIDDGWDSEGAVEDLPEAGSPGAPLRNSEGRHGISAGVRPKSHLRRQISPRGVTASVM
jgi:hypothetical protein